MLKFAIYVPDYTASYLKDMSFLNVVLIQLFVGTEQKYLAEYHQIACRTLYANDE
jgi:hypothetical protein